MAAPEPKTATAKKSTPAKTATAAKNTPAKKAAAGKVPASRRSTPKKSAPVPVQVAAAEPRPWQQATAPPEELSAVPAPAAESSGLRMTIARMLDHPGFAPELLALAAVEALGPSARDWAEQLRSTYPEASPDGLARLATRRFVRLAGAGGATSALAGALAPLAELTSVLWAQANLVLHLAAAYDRDPAHPDRAVELLVLTQVHPDAESARTALDAARALDGPGDAPWPRVVEAAWRLAAPLAAQAAGWLALRLASRLLPGAAVLAAAAGDAAAAERLAARAITAYRPARGG
ncbi:hypothetical protein SAMN05444858_1317 [Micromonospora avicenniae]|uniref:EcsC protein family protein n=2 Tax=Micromonospora avicenniae TaxID=1198245 RepID=A0A1N7F6H7_9ACTN|nr:hypothetical protein SAMN05444858_1317 [Micromonospora avicenniae]